MVNQQTVSQPIIDKNLEEKNGKSSRIKRIIGLTVILCFCIISIIVFISSNLQLANEEESRTITHGQTVFFVLLQFMVVKIGSGILFFLIGSGIYLFAYLTRCFTFNFNKPLLHLLSIKIFILKLILDAILFFIFYSLILAFLGPLVLLLGLPYSFTVVPATIISILIFLFFHTWVSILSPITKLIHKKRFLAISLSKEIIERETYAAILNLNKPGMMRYISISEDIGFLWLEPDRIRFRGDLDEFTIMREHYVRLELKELPNIFYRMAGLSLPVLIYHNPDNQQEQSIILAAGRNWTLNGAAKAQKSFAKKIKKWEKEGITLELEGHESTITEPAKTNPSPKKMDSNC